MKLLAYGRVLNGLVKLSNKTEFAKDIANFEGKEIVITVEVKSKKRSLKQNRYYWGVVVPLVKAGLTDAGWRYTTEQVHEDLKRDFNIVEIVNEQSGEIRKSIGSTTEMTTKQIMEYFAKITEWSAEYLGVEIPEPNEQLEIKYK